jgi:hypothetical protein
MHTAPHPPHRHVILEIGTITTDFAPGHRSVVSLNRRIAYICLLIDDGAQIVEYGFSDRDERLLLSSFWKRIKPYDIVIAENDIDGQFAFLCQRTLISGVWLALPYDLQTLYSHELVSARQLWEDLSLTGKSNIPDPAMRISRRRVPTTRVAELWVRRELNALVADARPAVHAVYREFLMVTGQGVPDRYADWAEDDDEAGSGDPEVSGS